MLKELQRKEHLSIPIQLLSRAQKDKIVPELGLYIFLLIHTSGTIRKGSTNYKNIRSGYVKEKRTFDANLAKLFKLNWIRFNQKSKVIHINSMNRIIYAYESYNTHRVKFKKSYLKYFREFVFASIVSERIHTISKGIKYGEKKGKYAELYKWSSIHHVTGFFPNYLGISIKSIKKLTNLSTGRVVELKKLSRNLELLNINSKYAYLKISTKEVPLFLRAYPRYDGRVKIKEGKVLLQLHDEIESNLIIISVPRKQAFQKVEFQNRKKVSKKLNLI